MTRFLKCLREREITSRAYNQVKENKFQFGRIRASRLNVYKPPAESKSREIRAASPHLFTPMSGKQILRRSVGLLHRVKPGAFQQTHLPMSPAVFSEVYQRFSQLSEVTHRRRRTAPETADRFSAPIKKKLLLKVKIETSKPAISL